MSKNQSDSVGPRSVCIPESLPSHQTLKTVVFAYFFLLSTIHPKSSTLLSLVGVAGFEPATLRLSSACSNQLSYTPSGIYDFRFMIYDLQTWRRAPPSNHKS